MNRGTASAASAWAGVRRAASAWAAGVALALVLVLVLAPVSSARAADPAVKAQQVAPDVWFVQGESAIGSSANRNFISNAAFVVTEEGVLVIDSLGSPALADELIAEIRRVTSQPIRVVVVTHYHADHIYGLQSFKAVGARVVAHASARSYLSSDTAAQRLQISRVDLFPFIDENTRLVPADEWITEPVSTLKLGRREFRLLHTGPAHTSEDLAVFDPASGVLFAGDIVFRGRVPWVGQADSRSWIDALDRVTGLKPRLLVPGHGPVSTTAVEDLALTRDYLVHLRRTMGEAASNLEPFDEAYARADWSRFEGLPLFKAANRMNAYNTYLLMEQQGR